MATDAPSADDLLTRMNAIAPPSSGQPSAPAAQSSAPSSDDLLRRMNAISPPAEQTTTAVQTPSGPLPYAPPAGTGARNIANALIGGIYSVGANVASNLGITPNPLPSDVQSAMAAHPVFRTAGELVGGTAVGLPIGVGLGAAAPVVGLEAGLGGAIATGGAAGAAQNVLTGDPNQSWYQRAGMGALEGAVLGGVTHKVFDWLGPEIAAATSRPAPGEAPPLPASATTNLLAPELQQRMAAGPAAGPTSAIPSAPPAVGAQVTAPGLATLTPGEVNAYRATAEGNKLLENQRIGEPDRTAYIPDVTPNLAEQEQTANAARELKTLGITSQDASQDMKLAAQANNDARTSYWNDTTRSPVDIQRAEAARDAQAQADLKATWANKTEADATPVQDAASQILAGPDGKRAAVRSAVNSVIDQLHDASGNLETDPEILYGVRKHIGDILSKEGQRETPLAARATDSLIALRDTLDGVIEDAAPGFKQYLQNFQNASKPIDEMQVLQDAAPNLFKGPSATLRYGDFQRFMKNVVDMRQGPGVNQYKSISDDTMQRLWNLRDDLRRSAGALELARAPGSDTAPNIIDAIKQYGKLGGSLVVDAAASHVFGPAGPLMVRGTRAMLAPITAARTARAQQARVREMLYPSNPLTQPIGGQPPAGSNPLTS